MILAATEGVCLFDPFSNIAFVNQRGADILARDAEDMLDLSFATLVHGDDREHFAEMLQASSDGTVARGNCRLLRPDGSDVEVKLSVQSLSDDVGSILGTLAMFADISERSTGEKDLSSARERLNLALLAGGLGQFDWDISSGLVRWSDEACALLNLKPTDLNGTLDDLFDRIVPDDRQRVQATLTTAATNGGERFGEEFRIASEHESIQWLKLLGQACADVDDEPRYVIGVIRDITERKLGQASRLELLESERREREKSDLAVLRLSSLQGLTAALSDARTREDVAAVVLQRAVPLFGAAAGTIGSYDAQTQTLRLLWSVGHEASFISNRQSYAVSDDTLGGLVVQGGRSIFLESIPEATYLPAELRERHSALGFMAAAATPLVFEDSTLGFLAFNYRHRQSFLPEERSLLSAFASQCAHALVRLQAYESELRARTAAEEALRQRELFLSAAAHELKTPLTSLRGFTQLITRRLNRGDTPGPEELDRALQVIDRQAVKLNALVDQILDVSRLESGRLALECSLVDLVELAQRIVGSLSYQSDRGSVVINAPDRLEALVDPDRIEQVLVNLLSNAQKYNRQDRPIELDLRQEGGDVVLSVRDFGPGFAPELLEGLVHPFKQSWPDDRLSGMGLGLFISREIIERHAGKLTAERPPGAGAKLIIRLPIGASSTSEQSRVP
jgi:PAS domain S-box-containing protein